MNINGGLTPKQAAAQRHYAKVTSHVYTEIEKTAISSTELYNLYGIVVDATMPHKKP